MSKRAKTRILQVAVLRLRNDAIYEIVTQIGRGKPLITLCDLHAMMRYGRFRKRYRAVHGRALPGMTQMDWESAVNQVEFVVRAVKLIGVEKSIEEVADGMAAEIFTSGPSGSKAGWMLGNGDILLKVREFEARLRNQGLDLPEWKVKNVMELLGYSRNAIASESGSTAIWLHGPPPEPRKRTRS